VIEEVVNECCLTRHFAKTITERQRQGLIDLMTGHANEVENLAAMKARSINGLEPQSSHCE
jgi:hypothetical protein